MLTNAPRYHNILRFARLFVTSVLEHRPTVADKTHQALAAYGQLPRHLNRVFPEDIAPPDRAPVLLGQRCNSLFDIMRGQGIDHGLGLGPVPLPCVAAVLLKHGVGLPTAWLDPHPSRPVFQRGMNGFVPFSARGSL